MRGEEVDAAVCRISEPGENLRAFSESPDPQFRRPVMNFVGVDLHKKTITLCVMDQHRRVLGRKTLYCVEPHPITE
jgi:hypothetical protein